MLFYVLAALVLIILALLWTGGLYFLKPPFAVRQKHFWWIIRI